MGLFLFGFIFVLGLFGYFSLPYLSYFLGLLVFLTHVASFGKVVFPQTFEPILAILNPKLAKQEDTSGPSTYWEMALV